MTTNGNFFFPNNKAKTIIRIDTPALIRDIVMTALLIWLVCPYQAFFENWYLYGVLWGVWIVFALIADHESFEFMVRSKYTVIAVIWPCTVFFLSLFDWAAFSPYQFTISLMLISFVYYAKGEHYASMRFFVVVYLIYTVLISLYSIQQLRINSELSRILASSDKGTTIKYAHPFMADFSTVNNVPLVSALAVFFAKVSKKRLIRILVALYAALNFYLLISAQYSIALFIFVISIAVVILFPPKDKSDIRKNIFILLMIIISIPVMGYLMKLLSRFIPDGYIYRRVRDLGNVLTFGGLRKGSDMEMRLQLYVLSLNTFLDNFLFGVGGKLYKAGGLVGGHSQVLDNFAYYGVFFGAEFVWYLVSIFKNGRRLFVNKFKGMYLLIFIIYLIQCTINTSYNEEMLFVMFFMVPTMLFLVQKRYNIPEIPEPVRGEQFEQV